MWKMKIFNGSVNIMFFSATHPGSSKIVVQVERAPHDGAVVIQQALSPFGRQKSCRGLKDESDII